MPRRQNEGSIYSEKHVGMSFPFPPSLTPFYAFSPVFVSRVAAVNLINFKQALLAWLMYSDGAKYLQKRERSMPCDFHLDMSLLLGVQSLHPAEELKRPPSFSLLFLGNLPLLSTC